MAESESGRPIVPPLPELLARYLQRQAAAHERGLATHVDKGEVTPYEAVPVQSLDPRLAWQEAMAAGSCVADAGEQSHLSAPPDWPALVAAQEPAMALPFCLGNFPQLVRNLQGLLQPPGQAPATPAAPVQLPGLTVWADQTLKNRQPLTMLLAAGVLRLARQFQRADEILAGAELPTTWQTTLANERAALTWSRGQHEVAAADWQAQPASIAVLFNRGMSTLFLNQPVEARTALRQAVDQLPDTDGWHHLGRLYLALAEMRQ